MASIFSRTKYTNASNWLVRLVSAAGKLISSFFGSGDESGSHEDEFDEYDINDGQDNAHESPRMVQESSQVLKRDYLSIGLWDAQEDSSRRVRSKWTVGGRQIEENPAGETGTQGPICASEGLIDKNTIEESPGASMGYNFNSNEFKIEGPGTPDPKSERPCRNNSKNIVYTRRKKRQLDFGGVAESRPDPKASLIKAAVSFVEKTKSIQGDREYSEWPGSILDSVVGAILAQNVRDDMSSDAFMSLARHFPPKTDKDISSWRGRNNAG